MKLTEVQKSRIEDIRSKQLVMLDGQYGAYVTLGSVICRELVPNEEGFDVIVKALYSKQEFKKTICEDLDSWLDKFQALSIAIGASKPPLLKSEFTPVHKDMLVKNEDVKLVKQPEIPQYKIQDPNALKKHNQEYFAKREDFVNRYIDLCRATFNIEDERGHLTDDGRLLVERARLELGFSDSTVSYDIYSTLKQAYRNARATNLIKSVGAAMNGKGKDFNKRVITPLPTGIQENVDRIYSLIKNSRYGVLIYSAIYKQANATHDNLQFYLDELVRLERVYKHPKLGIYAIDKKYLDNAEAVDANNELPEKPEQPIKTDNYHRTSPIHKFTKEQTLEMNEKRKTMLAADIAKEYGISKNQLNQWIFKAERDNWIEHVDMRKIPHVSRPLKTREKRSRIFEESVKEKEEAPMPEPIVYQPPAPKPERNKTLEPCMGLSMNTRLAMAAELTKELELLDKQIDTICARQAEIEIDLEILNV